MLEINRYQDFIKIMFKKFYSLIKTYKLAHIPGFIITILILVYTYTVHFSISYMGNSDSKTAGTIIQQFLPSIIFVLLKIILAYMLISLSLNILFFLSLKSIEKISGREFSSKKCFWGIFSGILAFYILSLFSAIIRYPQLYNDSFYNHGPFLSSFQRFLTDNINPYIFETLIWVLLLIPFITITILILKKKARVISLRINSRIIIASAAGILVYLAFTSGTSQPQQNNNRPNILILASDALRPDHFSCNGYNKQTTPFIDSFAPEGVQYNNIITTVPRTFPSWVSILTSRYPMQNKIRHMFPSSKTRNHKFVTLSSILRGKGYMTAVTGDFAADIFPRINLGFEICETPTFNFDILLEQIIIKNHIFLLPFIKGKPGNVLFPGIKEFAEYADPEPVTDSLISLIDRATDSKRPFFITSFYSATHFPFSSPWPYYKEFTEPGYKGPYKYLKNRIVQTDSSTGKGENKITDNDCRQIRALYDGCLKAFDSGVGRVLNYLKEKGIFENTIILIMSDHGENLHEYDYAMGHGEHLRGNLSLRIPFVIHYPGCDKGTNKKEYRSTIDIAPTILELTGIEAPGEFDGTSLLKTANRDMPVYIETGLWFGSAGDFFFQKKRILYPDITGVSEIEFDYNREICVSAHKENLLNIAKHRAIIHDEYKLIYMPTSKGITYELYDIRKDPAEQNDISASRPDILQKMKKKFWGLMRDDTSVIIKNEFILPIFQEPAL